VVTAAPYLVLAAVGAPVLAGLATMLLPASRRLTRLALATAGPATSVLLMAIHLGRNGVSTADTPTGTIAWVPSLNLDISFLVDGLNARYVAVGVDFRFGAAAAGTTETLIELGDRFGFSREHETYRGVDCRTR